MGYTTDMRLTREIRTWFGETAPADRHPAGNTWAGTCKNLEFSRFFIVRVSVEGDPDPQTGYVCDIRMLDQLALTIAANRIQASVQAGGPSLSKLEDALVDSFARASKTVPEGTELRLLELLLSPYTRLMIEYEGEMMLKLTQSYEFSASHRLAIPTMSDDENLKLFGKCSNPHGHGHNYVVEVTLAQNATDRRPESTNIGWMDRIVRDNVIEPFDHKNLNVECAEFSDLNPTVENIAAVIFSKLADHFGDTLLDSVRVWETPKTSAQVTRDRSCH